VLEDSAVEKPHKILENVVRLLMKSEAPKVSTEEFVVMLKREWRAFFCTFMKSKNWRSVLAGAGWSYVKGTGRAFGYFLRVSDDTQSSSATGEARRTLEHQRNLGA